MPEKMYMALTEGPQSMTRLWRQQSQHWKNALMVPCFISQPKGKKSQQAEASFLQDCQEKTWACVH
jgi:hypothetical protein